MTSFLKILLIAVLALLFQACGNPDGGTPGMALSGEEAAAFPTDWGFTDEIQEIAIEVHTPYLLRHSVTIWCASVDGKLYVAALDPESKHWPGWVGSNPDVRLAIGGKIYPATLVQLQNIEEIQPVATAYARKYNRELPDLNSDVPAVRYWRVEPRG